MSAGEPYLNVEIDRTASPVTVSAQGEVDAATADLLAGGLQEAAPDGSASVALDLSGVTFIDSSGLRVITGALRSATDAGNALEVTAASDPVRRIFSMTGLDGLIVG